MSGDLDVLDPGGVGVEVPGGIDAVRRALLDRVTDDDWVEARAGFGDGELASE